jgi:hypothetical protein
VAHGAGLAGAVARPARDGRIFRTQGVALSLLDGINRSAPHQQAEQRETPSRGHLRRNPNTLDQCAINDVATRMVTIATVMAMSVKVMLHAV